MFINKSKSLMLFSLLTTFTLFSQEKKNTKGSVVTKKTQPSIIIESNNPLDFGYEKKIINGKEVYIKKDNKSTKLVITYIPKQ
jgi:hypothetical protein